MFSNLGYLKLNESKLKTKQPINLKIVIGQLCLFRLEFLNRLNCDYDSNREFFTISHNAWFETPLSSIAVKYRYLTKLRYLSRQKR